MQQSRSSEAKVHPRICVPLCAKTFAELERLSSESVAIANLIELRLDCLDEKELVIAQQRVIQLAAHLPVPLIITLRPAEQGGQREIDFARRREFWEQLRKPTTSWFDIEKDLCESSLEIDWSRVICSHHDFSGVPNNLDDIYDEMAQTPAAILKIAVRANDTVDCLPILKLLDRARNDGRELLAVSMGDAGVATRILGPSRGSFLTYGALKPASGTAPGQLTAKQLKSVYRVPDIDERTRVYGLVGSPVMHSISPDIHNSAFEAEKINGVYLPFEVKNIRSFIERLVHPASRELDLCISGLSVTAPHKLEVMQFLNWIDPRATDIGAVNTVVVEDDRLRGYNTDVDGFIEPLLKAIELTANSKVAVIGAGGAANGAIWSLREKGAKVVLFARDPQKARPLAEKFEVPLERLDVGSFASFDVVINATPLGSFGKQVDETPATAVQLRGVRLAYDLVYNPIETPFLREAASVGCKTLGGLEMLVAQAQLQFKLWTGKEAPRSLMHAAALQALKSII
ncbi:MAG TPA: shikimate dehydrogenase [Pyrinomonadaceae bacterium]